MLVCIIAIDFSHYVQSVEIKDDLHMRYLCQEDGLRSNWAKCLL